MQAGRIQTEFLGKGNFSKLPDLSRYRYSYLLKFRNTSLWSQLWSLFAIFSTPILKFCCRYLGLYLLLGLGGVYPFPPLDPAPLAV